MKFNLKGEIKTCKKLSIKGQECYGLTRAVDKAFTIKILESTLKDPWLFCETMLHEILHLYIFIVMSYAQKYNISEAKQHKIIDKYVELINIDVVKMLGE